MKSMTIDEFRDKIVEIIKEVNESDETVFIGEQNEEPLAVLLSLDEWEIMKETIKILSDKEISDIIFDRVEGDTVTFEEAKKILELDD